MKEQALALANSGVNINVLNLQPRSIRVPLKKNIINIETSENYKLFQKYINTIKLSKFRRLYQIEWNRKLVRLFKQCQIDKNQIDLIYAHFSFPSGAGAIELGRLLDKPVVVLEHLSSLMKEHIDNSLLNCLKRTVDRADRFICVSSGLKAAVQKHTNTKKEIFVVSNMINDCFKYNPRVAKDKFIFFALGNLIKRKRFDLLIRAFASCFKNNPNVCLRIGGSGEEEEYLKKLAYKLAGNQVEFLGGLSRAETFEQYKECDCFVLPSRHETYGLVYREALAVGRPIISTKHGGFSGHDWDPQYGCLIDVDDEDALINSMQYMYDNYKNVDHKSISKRVLEDCSSDSIVKKLMHIFENTVSEYCNKRVTDYVI